MSQRTPLKATFDAFKNRSRSGVLVRASAVFALGSFLLAAVFIGLNFSAFGALIGWYGDALSANASGGEPAMPPLVAFLQIFSGALIWLFLVYVLMAAYETACLRWLIHGEVGRGLYGLNLGAPTWRTYSAYWLWYGLYFAASFVSSILSSIILFAFMMSGGEMLVAVGINYLVSFVMLIPMAYFAVRLAPAAAIGVARSKFSFFRAWTITKGRFWALFGSFFLLFLIYMIATAIIYALAFALVAAAAGITPSALTSYDNPQIVVNVLIEAFISPVGLVVWAAMIALYSVAFSMFLVATYGVNARAVRVAMEEGVIQAPA